jgi:hypothetical protein
MITSSGTTNTIWTMTYPTTTTTTSWPYGSPVVVKFRGGPKHGKTERLSTYQDRIEMRRPVKRKLTSLFDDGPAFEDQKGYYQTTNVIDGRGRRIALWLGWE